MNFSALELVYADFYRTAGDIQRMAEMAGLDPTKLAVQGTSPAVSWHNVLILAEQESRMSDLYALVRKEHPRNTELPAAWAAYQESAAPPAQPVKRKPPRGQAGEHLSDYRMDNRIDSLQKEVADLRAQLAELKSTLNFMITQNNALNDQNKTILAVLEQQNRTERKNHEEVELPHAIQWYVAGFLLIVLVVFAIVYFGGHV